MTLVNSRGPVYGIWGIQEELRGPVCGTHPYFGDDGYPSKVSWHKDKYRYICTCDCVCVC